MRRITPPSFSDKAESPQHARQVDLAAIGLRAK